MIEQLMKTDLEAGIDEIYKAPQDNGTLEMIVIRPDVDERKAMPTGKLTVEQGLVGDNWLVRGRAVQDAQIAIMSSRVIGLLSPDKERWPLAGDQLFVDLDLREANLSPGQRLAVGTAVLEITAKPHTGCKKFAQRFGADAERFVNSPEGKTDHFRGIYAKVLQDGTIKVGDTITKIT